MRVLMLSGDPTFAPGQERYELMRGAVDELVVVQLGRGRLLTSLPTGAFDVVTAQDPVLRGVFALLLARRYGARVNIQVHADPASYGALKRALARLVLMRASSVRVVTASVERQVRSWGVVAPITVLPVFVNLERFRRVVRVPHEGMQILWVGRFEKEKDPATAIALLREIRAKGVLARLTMLGAGSLESSLRSAALDLPVDFPGWQDPTSYLATADVVLSTSPYESWGASVVEALAAGVPVVSLDVGVAREAGARVADRRELSSLLVETLAEKPQAHLALTLLEAPAWSRAWQQSLL